MDIYQRIAEQRIQESIDRGDFIDLPGEGEPLDMYENPFEPPEMRMVFNLLEKNGYKLPWIERLIEIRQEIELIQKALRDYKISHSSISSTDQNDIFQKRVQQINKKILDYNICAPNGQLQIPTINLDNLTEGI